MQNYARDAEDGKRSAADRATNGLTKPVSGVAALDVAPSPGRPGRPGDARPTRESNARAAVRFGEANSIRDALLAAEWPIISRQMAQISHVLPRRPPAKAEFFEK